MLTRKHQGFSLIELMTVLVITAILIGFGMPSLQATMSRNAITSEVLRLSRSLSFARSEAVNKQQVVTLNKKSATNRDWSEGWTSYTDAGGQGNQAINTADGDLLLQDLTVTASNITMLSNITGNNWITFSPQGRLMEAGPVVLAICDTAMSDRVAGSLITISLIGRVTSTPIAATPAAAKAAACAP